MIRLATAFSAVDIQVKKAFRGAPGIKGVPVMIDTWKEGEGTYYFSFEVEMDVDFRDTKYVDTSAQGSGVTAPVKLPYGPSQFLRLVTARLENAFADPYGIEVTSFPSRKLSYVNALDKRRGEKPIAYFTGKICRFEFVTNIDPSRFKLS
jgi:hypothetical protein